MAKTSMPATVNDLNKVSKTILNGVKELLKDFPTKKDVQKLIDDSLHNQFAEFNEYIMKPQFEEMEKRLTEKMATKEELQKMEARLSMKIDNQSKDFIKKKDIKRIFA